MTKVIDRNTVKMERLNPEYFPSGRSLRLDVYMLEGGERAYKIFMYDHRAIFKVFRSGERL